MERLTEIRGDTVYYTGKHTKMAGLDCASTMRVAAVRDVMQRLAAYEATGLEPEEIKSPAVQIEIQHNIFTAETLEALHRMGANAHRRGEYV